MSSDFLSQEEVDALLRGVSGESDEPAAAEVSTEGVRPYNLATQERIVRGRMPTMELINDHNPLPLRGQFDSGLYGAFSWTALENGPEQWRVEIAKPADSKPVHGVDSCCGACGG